MPFYDVDTNMLLLAGKVSVHFSFVSYICNSYI